MPSTGTLSVLYTFDGTAGVNPTDLAIDASGDLFGITQSTSATGSGSTEIASGDGTLFEVPAADPTTATILYTFNDATLGTSPTVVLTDAPATSTC